MILDLGLPSGVRDHGPEAAARLVAVSGRLAEVFARHGYRRVIVPSIERAPVVARGLGPEAQARLFNAVEPGTGEVVAVCPDHTAQVARMWAAGLHQMAVPVRVSYVGPVLRAQSDPAGRPREIYQAGVECLGASGPLSDAELVLLCGLGLEACGLSEVTIDLGHASFVGAFLDAAGLEGEAREQARELLARKDAPSLEGFVSGLPAAPARARRARAALPELAGLYGQGTLERARRLARRTGVGGGAVDEVEGVLEALAGVTVPARLTADLGETRGSGYYTGLTLQAFAAGAGTEVAVGGRYDDLLGRYGRPAPAVGLAVDLGLVVDALGPQSFTDGGVLLVAGAVPPAEGVAIAAALRRAGHRVAVTGAADLEEARRLAREQGLAEILWASPGPRWRRAEPGREGTTRVPRPSTVGDDDGALPGDRERAAKAGKPRTARTRRGT